MPVAYREIHLNQGSLFPNPISQFYDSLREMRKLYAYFNRYPSPDCTQLVLALGGVGTDSAELVQYRI
jgi:hypothetical protein